MPKGPCEPAAEPEAHVMRPDPRCVICDVRFSATVFLCLSPSFCRAKLVSEALDATISRFLCLLAAPKVRELLSKLGLVHGATSFRLARFSMSSSRASSVQGATCARSKSLPDAPVEE